MVDDVGEPARWYPPMAATLARDGRLPGDDQTAWSFEPKLDGVRVLAWIVGGEVRLLSRNRIHQEDVYPEVVDGLRESVLVDAVLDGEVVAYDDDGVPRFGRLQQRMHVHSEVASRRSPVRVTFVVFDVLWAAGRDVRAVPLDDRRTVLSRLVEPGPAIEVVTPLDGSLDELLDRARDESWEGLIAKRRGSHYHGRRSPDWLKLKVVRQQEMVVVGFTEPRGGRTGLGALLLGYHHGERLRYGGKVGTGFSESVLRDLRARLDALEVVEVPVVDPPREPTAHWVRPLLVAQVGFAEWSEAGRMRHSRFLGLRDDKDPADVVRE